MGAAAITRIGTGARIDSIAHLAQLRALVDGGEAGAARLLPTAGNRFQLFEGADEWIPALVADIRGAERQVHFSSYALQPGAPGGQVQQVVDALVERAQAGVPVSGIIDQVGAGLLLPGATRTARRAFVEELRDNRVDLLVKPLRLGRGPLGDARLAVDHRKLYEIDGRITHGGGMNLVDGWLPWHDVMLRAEGPTAAQAGAVLAARWRDLGGRVAAERVAILEDALLRPVTDARHATELLTNGNLHRRELTQAFIADARAVATADEPSRLWVANPYLADPAVMRPVVDAARAGHDVRLWLSPKATAQQPQDLFTDPLRRAWAWEVANAGGPVIALPEFSHAKVLVAQVGDAPARASVGAFNLDRGSTRRNYENAVRSADPSMVAMVEDMLQRQTGRGARVSEDAVAGWRGLAKWRERLHLSY